MSNRSAPQFDIYPELDRHINQTTDFIFEPDEPDAFAKIVKNRLAERPEVDELSEHVKDWAYREINVGLGAWYDYGNILVGTTVSPRDNPVPASIEQLKAEHPNLDGCLQNLYDSLYSINAESDAEGDLLGKNLNLVLVPWKQFQIHYQSDFLGFVRALRQQQKSTGGDYMDPKLVEAIEINRLMYRNPLQLEHSHDQPDVLMDVEDYLELKISQDGPWGVMLMQTSNVPGAQKIPVASANKLTGEGQEPLMLNGVRVDTMGVFEYLALSLQFSPVSFSKTTSKNPGSLSWLLANRLDRGHEWNVPFVYTDSKPAWKLASAGKAKSNRRPRLAVAG